MDNVEERVFIGITKFAGKVPDVPLDPEVERQRRWNGSERPFLMRIRLIPAVEITGKRSIPIEPQIFDIVQARLATLGSNCVGHRYMPEEGLWILLYIPPGEMREKIRRLKREHSAVRSHLTVCDQNRLSLVLYDKNGDQIWAN